MLVMSLGMLALAGVQTNLRANSDVARQRAEATRIASEEMEGLRFFTTIDPVATQTNPSYSELVSRTLPNVQLPGSTNNTTYTLTRNVNRLSQPPRMVVQVSVSWTDRADVNQSVVLNSVISGADPRLGALLMTPAIVPTIASNRGRHASIPPAAVDLGTTSAFKPQTAGGVAWVFNNTTGFITSVCTDVAVGNADITAAVIAAATCTPVNARLLSGVIRYNYRGGLKPLGDGTSALKPVDSGRSAWVFDDTTHRVVKVCTAPASKATANLEPEDLTGCSTVSGVVAEPYAGTGALTTNDARNPIYPALNVQVDFQAVNPANGTLDSTTSTCYPRAATGSAAVSSLESQTPYYCIIYPANATTGWGGRFNLSIRRFEDNELDATTLTAGGQYKVCRYSTAASDTTANTDHPKYYCFTNSSLASTSTCPDTRVKTNLTNQNFLVIHSSKSCPSDTTTVSVTGGTLVNVNTRQHQP